MKGLEGGFQAPACDVGVAIGGANVLMPKHVLDQPQIGPIFEQMGRK